MKFDLHCHTKEGSVDSKVSVGDYVKYFKAIGFDGFMIADHNSYRGCKAWDEIKDNPEFDGITVIRGMEYDTKDAGHILVIMPDDVYLRILKIRGMRCKRLIAIVHALGGVLGPAHPFGVASSSMMGFKKMKPYLLKHVDFVEVFNTCEQPLSNQLAGELAKRYRLPGIAGSDAHVEEYIGMACTDIHYPIHCNNDLIHAIKLHATITAGGTERVITRRGKYKENWIGKTAYRIYNRGLGKLKSPRRGLHHIRLRKQHRHIP